MLYVVRFQHHFKFKGQSLQLKTSQHVCCHLHALHLPNVCSMPPGYQPTILVREWYQCLHSNISYGHRQFIATCVLSRGCISAWHNQQKCAVRIQHWLLRTSGTCTGAYLGGCRGCSSTPLQFEYISFMNTALDAHSVRAPPSSSSRLYIGFTNTALTNTLRQTHTHTLDAHARRRQSTRSATCTITSIKKITKYNSFSM